MVGACHGSLKLSRCAGVIHCSFRGDLCDAGLVVGVLLLVTTFPYFCCDPSLDDLMLDGGCLSWFPEVVS
ncbi:hypothetical protein Nepgr_033782, partial [Nepenthes gracilis]